MTRLYSLDYLRGLAATSIMIYHYISWNYGHLDVGSALGRIGIYGVSIFYVLSGLTLHAVYDRKMNPSLNDVKDFIIKRIARIFPLLWLCTTLVIILDRGPYDPWLLFLNYSGLFSFIEWQSGIATGIWSIGNELVFYTFFPLFVLLSKKSSRLFFIVVLTVIGLYAWFGFAILTPEKPLSSQWSTYVNPLNQLALFLSGFLIGHLNGVTKLRSANLTILIACVTSFVLLKVDGNPINIVTDWNRILFSLCGIGICMSFYNLSFHLNNPFGRTLSFLGEISYSIYLLHPIIWTLCYSFLKRISPYVEVSEIIQIVLPVTVTIFASSLIYNTYEKFFIRKGKAITEKHYSDRITP